LILLDYREELYYDNYVDLEEKHEQNEDDTITTVFSILVVDTRIRGADPVLRN
jgi:hypothetical protein